MNYEKNKTNILLGLKTSTLKSVFNLALKQDKEKVELRRNLISTLKALRNLNRQKEHYKKILFKKGGKRKWFLEN